MEFQELFKESKGKPIIYKGKEVRGIDNIILDKNEAKFRLRFISTKSEWEQGIFIETKGHFEVNGKKIQNSIVLWDSTSPKEVDFFVNSKSKSILIYNAWKNRSGLTLYWYNGPAMIVSENKNSRIYNCNDGYPDDDFDDLIFELTEI